MNRYITSSIFLAAGLSSPIVAAQNNQSLKGSDTLLDLTKSVIASCGSACSGLTYVGTGSVVGENAMAPGPTSHNIAPMSRLLNGGVTSKTCNPNGVTTTLSSGAAVTYTQSQVEQAACGLVIGLDGVAMLGSMYTSAKPACDGPTTGSPITGYPPTSSGSGTPPVGQTLGLGLAYDSTITWGAGNSPTYGPGVGKKATYHAYNGGTYTFSDWRDVLRVVYAGYSHDSCQDCESDVRNGILQNWGNLFEDGNTAPTNCNGPAGPTCTQLRHAWRRDSESGTTETFLALLGLPGVTRDPTTNTAIDDPFCNSWRSAATAGTNHPLPSCVEGGVTITQNDYPPDFRDQDPIRRLCASDNAASSGNVPTEQVCGRDGKLGVVLPIVALDFLTTQQAFPTAASPGPCTGLPIYGTAPPKNATGIGSDGRCPNGDAPVFINQCLIPVSASGDANCMAIKSDTPTFVNDTACAFDGVGDGAADGRVYGLHVYQGTTGSAGYRKDQSKRPITGAFGRIHASLSMNTANATLATCQFLGATQQIGCLVQADECSIGYAGREARATVPGGYPFSTVGTLLIHGWAASDANIQNNFAYPLSRKLYLNTMIGFDNVWGQEFQLAKAEANGSTIGPALTANGMVSLPGGTYCEDFNEQMLGCTANPNVNGCAAMSGSLCSSVTTCGDGNRDAYEDCDDGLSNGTASSNCTISCRTKAPFPASCGAG